MKSDKFTTIIFDPNSIGPWVKFTDEAVKQMVDSLNKEKISIMQHEGKEVGETIPNSCEYKGEKITVDIKIDSEMSQKIMKSPHHLLPHVLGHTTVENDVYVVTGEEMDFLGLSIMEIKNGQRKEAKERSEERSEEGADGSEPWGNETE